MNPFEIRRKIGKYDGVATNVPGSAPGLVGWVGVWRVKLTFRWPDGEVDRTPSAVSLISRYRLNVPSDCEVIWRIQCFDVDASYDYEASYWDPDSMPKNERDYFALSEPKVEEILLRLGVDVGALRDMVEVCYPFA